MVANEIAGSGQVDVFLGGGSRWTTSSSTDLSTTSTCHTSSRLLGITVGGGVGSTASAPTTTPPGGHTVNLSQQQHRYGAHYAADRHRTTAVQGWTDTRHHSSDIGPSETDEKGLAAQHTSSHSSVAGQQKVNHLRDDSGDSAVYGSTNDAAAIRISVCGGLLDQSADGEDLSSPLIDTVTEDGRRSTNIHAGVVNDALDARQKPDDQQHDDKMPRQSSHYDSSSVSQQHAQWQMQLDNDENIISTSSSGGVIIAGVPLKSALKRPPALRSSGVAGSLQHLQSLRKKARVRFNEALNTFLECDYVIYVDDDEYDLLYHLDAVAAAAAAAAAAAQAEAELGDPATTTETDQPQLVNVRSFELQLPETSVTSTCVSHGTTASSTAAASSADAGTLSPPDGYKDAAAFYAAAAALVELENHHLSGFSDDGVDVWETEDYDDEEADETEAFDNGWVDVHMADESPKIEANRQEQLQPEPMSDGSDIADVVAALADVPRTGILKGGKLWRGVVNNNNDSSQNNSSSASSSTAASSIGGEEATLSRHGEKSPAVRFIHLNDAQSGGDSAEEGGIATATNAAGTASGGQSQRSTGHYHNSAFQQLFPRARKLLQELPEAEIQRLTTAARANNAPSSVSFSSSSRAGVTSLSHSSESNSDTTDASDLKYEKALRVAEVTDNAEESHPPTGGSNAAAARLGVQYSADYYQIIKRMRSASAAENAKHQRKMDAAPPTAADSLVERLKWLTTDVDDDTTEDSGVAEEREAADGGSDLEMAAMQLAAYASVPVENVEHIQEVEAEEDNHHHQTALRSEAEESSGTGEASNSCATLIKPTKSGGGNEKSTYRKLNELFFRTKSKDKNKDASKSSNSSLNRSFSPPPPAEVEPKMKPSKKQHQPHLIHIVGLTGKSSSSVSASTSSGASGTETLGRIPNVVPTVDHVYRVAVDLVTRNTGHQLNHPSGMVHSGIVIQVPAGNDSYSLDDIDAALHAQMSASGGATEAIPPQCMYLLPSNHRIPEDSRDETGGSRSSGSSGDSGLGLSSHDTSLTGMSDTTTDAGCAQDELQAFVRQDATQGRIDRIKKRYSAALEPDEAEDYGFLRRPSVRGIKTRFGSTSEIIQQMQAQLAGPMPAVSAARATGQTHVNWSSYAEQSSIQAEALLDPREKRRSAMMAMSNSVHLPALPEDAGYFHQQHQQLIHNAGRNAHANAMAANRPASVMNIYGSTGDLYQHLRAPMRPVMVRHPPLTSSSVMAGGHPAQLLERTSSVSSVSSGIDASAVYGTIRRQPPQVMHPSYVHPDSISPTRDYAPAVMMQHVQQQQQQQHHMQQQQHHQMPLRMTVSTPGGPYMSNPQQQQRPVSQQMTAGSMAYYATAQDYALQQQQFQMQQQHQQHYVYATLPSKRQSPYGVPASMPISVGSQVVSGGPTVLDSTRYRQVLPQMTSQVTLRPSSALADPRYSTVSAIHAGHLQPPAQQQQSAAPTLKDEREGPEGASSSPGLTHHDVNM